MWTTDDLPNDWAGLCGGGILLNYSVTVHAAQPPGGKDAFNMPIK